MAVTRITPNFGFTVADNPSGDAGIALTDNFDGIDAAIPLPAVITYATAGPFNIVSANAWKTITNTGTNAKVLLTLPAAAAGLGPFEIVIQDVLGIRMTAGTGDVIQLYDTGGTIITSITGGYVESTTVGSKLRFSAIDSTTWICENWGTWTLQTS